MTITMETYEIAVDVESIAGYEDMRRRFMDGFEAFVNQKKLDGARKVLRDELGESVLAKNEDFVQAVAAQVNDEALIEKPYIFLSVNPKLHELAV